MHTQETCVGCLAGGTTARQTAVQFRLAQSISTAAFARLVVLGVALAWGQPLSASDHSPEAPGPAKGTYELPATGRNIARKGGGWINGTISNFWLVLSFYDADKKPIAPDVKHGVVQFRKPGTDIRTSLYRKGDTLVSTDKVTPPYVFSWL